MAEIKSQTSSSLFYGDLLRRWSAKKKIGLTIIVFLCGVLVVSLIQMYRFSDFQLLYGDLQPQDFSSVTNWLDLRNINYKTDREHGNIYVSANRIHQARIEMAEQQIPRDLEDAFGLIDKNRLLLIEALSDTDYRIALQRDLSKTVAALDHVQSARVHLNIPDGSSRFSEAPSATIVVIVKPDINLSTSRLQAIRHLVSGAVSGLRPDRIRILDSSGTLLSRDSAYIGGDFFSTDALSYQNAVEENLEKRAREIVETMIGSDQTLIAVAAEIDFTRSETTAEMFDPEEPVIRKEESQQQSGNIEPGESVSSIASQNSYLPPITTASKIDYEINKTTSKTIKPVGTVKKLSATILVSEKKMVNPDGTTSYHPRSQEDLDSIKSLVAAAISLQPDRGDKIHLGTIPTHHSDIDLLTPETSSLYDLFVYLPILKFILLAAGLLLIYFFVIRPIIAMLKDEVVITAGDDLPQGSIEEQEPPAGEVDLTISLRNEVLSNPSPAAYIIKKWIQET